MKGDFFMNNIKTKRGRKWLITINNPTIEFKEIKNIIEKKYKTTIYYCYCEEIGNETHTRHYHIFIYYSTSLFNLFPNFSKKICLMFLWQLSLELV